MQSYEILEHEFSQWVRKQNVVACASGTTALHLALEAFQFPLGSEVIVPDFTMIACARAVVLAGHTPVFVDCKKEDLTLDPSLIADKITEKTVAIMPVHIYGRSCDMASIVKIAQANKLKIIEDCAEFHGGRLYGNETVDASCWSFYSNKIIAGEEGGAISFQDPEQAKLAKQLRSLGFTEAHDFTHIPRGVNGRLSNVHAELILMSLHHWADNQEKRRQVVEWYNKYVPSMLHMPPREANWVYDIRVPNLALSSGQKVEWVVKKLNDRGIAARCGFKPCSGQPEFFKGSHGEPEAFRASCEVLYLPIAINMTERRVTGIVEALREALGDQ